MTRRLSLRVTAALLIPLVSGCQTAPMRWTAPAVSSPPVPVQTAASVAADPVATPMRSNGLVVEKPSATEPLVQLGTATQPGSAARAGHSGKDEAAETTLTFVDTDIREVVRTILGGILKVNYSIDPNVHGTATLDTSAPLPRSALIPTLTTLLAQNGATLIQRDGTYLVLPNALAAGAAALPGAGAPTAGSEVVNLHYASAPQLAKVLEPYTAETGRILADPAHNALLVSGDGSARASLVALIHAFDVDLLAGQSYALFPVSSGQPGKAAADLQKVLMTENDGRLAGMVRVVPMERTNAVLVVSPQAHYIEEVRRIYGLLEKGQNALARNWHVYYVQNGDAGDLGNVLQKVFTPGKVTEKTSSVGSTSPSFETVSLGSGSSNGTSSGSNGLSSSGMTSGTTSGTPSNGTGTAPGQASSPNDKTRSPATDPLSADSSEQGDDAAKANSMRIVANRHGNALLIYATAEEYSVVEGMLAKLDVLPLQVMIEATIAEVTLNDNLQYGTQFFFKNGGLNGTLSTIADTSITNGGTGIFGGTYPAFVLNKASGAVKATLSALQDVTEVKVLSSPQLLVLDNESAMLMVGDQVPILTQQATSTLTSTFQTTNSVDYHSTGVILQVLPRVNSGGLVTLDISQEVSDVATTTSSTLNSPTFQERKVKSRVVVQDGQTVGLAGLIRDTASQGNSGVPFLKDIPLLGSLVSNQDNTRQRTELLVLITPRVLHDQRDARALTNDLRAKLGSADLVPFDKAGLRPSGSSNPNAALDP